jgi:hypothetical protein
MKSLSQYINEKAEITNIRGDYRDVILVRHSGIDCANLTEDEFVDLMWADLEEALDEYKGLVHGETVEKRAEYIQRRVKEAEEYAEKRWKKNIQKRQEYISRAKFNAENDKWGLCGESGISFDFNPEVSNETPQCCILNPTRVTDKQLRECYRVIQKSAWWKKSQGWLFRYTCYKHTFKPSFPAQIDLILSPSQSAEKRQAEEDLAKYISSWYEEGKYMGD